MNTPNNQPALTPINRLEKSMTRLKAAWQQIPEDRQKEWREKLVSEQNRAAVRAELNEEFGLALGWDSQVNRFRNWIEEQDEREERSHCLRAIELCIHQTHPDWTLDQVRAEVLRQAYYETLARGNFDLGLRTVAVDVRVKKYELDRKKFEFDATQASLARLPELKAIAGNPNMTEAEKAKAIEEVLFPHGKIPRY